MREELLQQFLRHETQKTPQRYSKPERIRVKEAFGGVVSEETVSP